MFIQNMLDPETPLSTYRNFKTNMTHNTAVLLLARVSFMIPILRDIAVGLVGAKVVVGLEGLGTWDPKHRT